jgi:hypothetical protein
MRIEHADVLPTDEDLRCRISTVLENATERTGRMHLADLACRTGLSQQHVLELVNNCPLRGFKVDKLTVAIRRTKES